MKQRTYYLTGIQYGIDQLEEVCIKESQDHETLQDGELLTL